MRTSQNGLDLIKHFEGCELTAYVCPAGVLTVGYGHTGADVKPGMTITQQEAERLLEQDLIFFERSVIREVKSDLDQDEFDALVSFTYNLGPGNLRASTLLRKLNAGDREGAAREFPRWNKAGGKVLAGLTRRREAEQRLFRGESWKA